MVSGVTPTIGMPIIRTGYIDSIRNGLSIARTGGWPTTEVILNGLILHTGDGTRCGPTAPMTEVISGAMRDGGASETQPGSMLIIRNGPKRIRDGFVTTTVGTRNGFIQRIGANILETGTTLTRSTAGSSAGTSSISIPTLLV